MGRRIKLKQGIRKGTIIEDFYDDDDYYYIIGNTMYPVDFNNFKHSEFCEELELK